MSDFEKDLNGIGRKITEQEIETARQSIKLGYMEAAIKEFKEDITKLFNLVTDIRLETKALTTRGFLIQSIVLILIQAGIALWLKY